MAKPYAGPAETDLCPNRDEIYALFEYWFRHNLWGRIEIGWANPRSGGINRFKLFEIGENDEIADFIVETNLVPGQSVYWRPATVSTTDEDLKAGIYTTDKNFVEAGGLWADLDDSDSVKNASKVYSTTRPGAFIRTGSHPHQRVQLLWKTSDTVGGGDFVRRINQAIADKLKADPAVVNPTTLLRVGGTIAWPYKDGRQIELTQFKIWQDGRPDSLPLHAMARGFPIPNGWSAEAEDGAEQPKAEAEQPRQQQHSSGGGAGALNTAKHLIGEIRAGRNWHNNMIALIAHWLGRGWTNDEILATAEGFTLSGYTVQDTRREMAKAIQGGRDKWQIPNRDEDVVDPPKAPPADLPLIWFNDIRPNLDVADFVEELLGEGQMSVVYGESNSGKTFFMSDLALYVARGAPWRGKAVEQGGVIYCALEGGHGIKNRVAAFREHYGIEASLPFAVVPSAINLLDPEADTPRLIELIKAAAETIKPFPVKLVVIDTLSRALSGGNENAPDDMGALVINADKIRQATTAHLGFVHHNGKDAAKGARGHSLLRAATDTEIEVTRDHETGISVARVTKQREMEIGGEFPFRLEVIELGENRRGKAVTSCVCMPVSDDQAPPPKKRGRKPKDETVQAALSAFRNCYAQCQESAPLSSNLPGQKCVRTGTVLEWLRRSGLTGSDTTDANRKAADRYKIQLITLGYAREFDGWMWPTDRNGQNGT
jgi:hypothetical protein